MSKRKTADDLYFDFKLESRFLPIGQEMIDRPLPRKVASAICYCTLDEYASQDIRFKKLVDYTRYELMTLVKQAFADQKVTTCGKLAELIHTHHFRFLDDDNEYCVINADNSNVHYALMQIQGMLGWCDDVNWTPVVHDVPPVKD